MNPGEEKRFDELLRDKFNGFEAAPNAEVWQAVSQTLPHAKPGLLQRALPFGLGTAFGIMISLGFVTGYEQWSDTKQGNTASTPGVYTPANQSETTQAQGTAVNSGSSTAQLVPPAAAPQPAGTENALAIAESSNSVNGSSQSSRTNTATYSHRRYVTSEYEHNRYITSERGSATNSTTRATQLAAAKPQPNSTPAVAAPAAIQAKPAQVAAAVKVTSPSAWLMGHELDTAIAKALTGLPSIPANSSELKELLKAQGTVLAVLQNRNDSLLLAIQDADLDSTIAQVRITRPRKHSSSIKPPVGWPSPSDWAVTANYEVNPQWGSIVMNEGVAKATENVRLSRNMVVGVRHRVNQRFGISAGVGAILVESEMNYSHKGTTGTHTIDLHQFLRPQYNFITVPVAMHFRIGGYSHMGVGLNLGLQTNLYRGGTQPVYRDGQYMLAKTGASDGPFKSISMAATSGIDLNYRVSPRFTVQAGPTLRYWAINPYKQADSGHKFLPGLQLGASWDL